MSSGQPISGGVPERELAGVQHERLAVGHGDRVHQPLLALERIDVRQAAVAHHPELVAEAHVDAGRLHQLRVVGVDAHVARNRATRAAWRRRGSRRRHYSPGMRRAVGRPTGVTGSPPAR